MARNGSARTYGNGMRMLSKDPPLNLAFLPMSEWTNTMLLRCLMMPTLQLHK
jgi:hypothetical protein